MGGLTARRLQHIEREEGTLRARSSTALAVAFTSATDQVPHNALSIFATEDMVITGWMASVGESRSRGRREAGRVGGEINRQGCIVVKISSDRVLLPEIRCLLRVCYPSALSACGVYHFGQDGGVWVCIHSLQGSPLEVASWLSSSCDNIFTGR